jgi:nitrous oxidase accessory protein NosD
MKSYGLRLGLLSVTAVIASASAQAGTLTRSFVSSAGVDSNGCTIAAPCATFAAAYNAVAADGIIAALDPGKYGPLIITMPVTVNGNGWAAITGTANGNGITVNISGGTGNVILTGLEVDGAGAAYNGIVFESGASLTISDCIVKDFVAASSPTGNTGNGIWIGPTAGTVVFTIVNTVALNNAYYGISYWPQSGNATVTGTIDHVFAAHNTTGGSSSIQL